MYCCCMRNARTMPAMLKSKGLAVMTSPFRCSQKSAGDSRRNCEIPACWDAPRAFILPKEFVTAVSEVPWGAYPTSCLPYYSTDYQELLRYVESEQSRRNSKSHRSSRRSDSAANGSHVLRTETRCTQTSVPFTCASTRILGSHPAPYVASQSQFLWFPMDDR